MDEVALRAAPLSQPGRAVAHQGGRGPGAGVRRGVPEAGRADLEPQESGQGLAAEGTSPAGPGAGGAGGDSPHTGADNGSGDQQPTSALEDVPGPGYPVRVAN